MPPSHASRMRVRRPRLLIPLCALTAVGFFVGILVHSWTSDEGETPPTSVAAARQPLSARVPSDVAAPANPHANVAAQQTGPPDPEAQKTAAAAAETAARAAADLSSK